MQLLGPAAAAGDFNSLTTAHQDALVRAGLTWHFDKHADFPVKGATESHSMFPHRTVMEFLCKTAWEYEKTVKLHRLAYAKEMR